MMPDYSYYKHALQSIPKPCAFVDVHAFNKNMDTIAKHSNGKNIRIASKSIRSIHMLNKILSFSNVFQGIMCFTADEAIYLSTHHFDDLLVAYPTWNEEQLRKVCNLTKKGKVITLMVDSLEHIIRLEKIAKEEKGTFLVCLDIDLSSKLLGIYFGVHRSPIKTTNQAVHMAKRITDSSFLQLDGIMGYEAQIAGVTDNDPRQKMKSNVIRFLKEKSSKQLIQKRQAIISSLEHLGIFPRFVNGGGTGSLHQTSLEEHVTEVTVGSGFFNSHLFDYYKDFKYSPAAGFAIEITRKPAKHIYTCYGGGYVASGAVGEDKLPKVFLPKEAKLTTNEAAGEVQTPILYDGDIQLKHGDPIFMRHSKAGELCERFQYLHLIKNGKIVKKVNTYRGDGQCFL